MTQHQHDEKLDIDGGSTADDIGLADDLDLKDAEEADAVKGGVTVAATLPKADTASLNPQPLPPLQGPEKTSLL
ncbi:MAG: hypothetical protein ABSD82_14080 [Solirubrobacteraceae bacterium]|jgi:hypothetical protein